MGTCLSFAEQKKILKKAKVEIKNLSDHQIHTTLVQCAKKKGPISLRLQHLLESKYKAEISEWGNCEVQQFFAQWKVMLRKGDIAALLWVGATNPQLDSQATNCLFGDYHMLMHGQGAIIRRQLQTVTTLKRQLAESKQNGRELYQSLTHAKEALQKSNRRQDALEARYKEVEAHNQHLRQQPQPDALLLENEALHKRILLLENRLAHREDILAFQAEQLCNLEAEKVVLTQNVDEQANLIDFYRLELELLSQRNDPLTEACANCVVCPYRVLIVGGMLTLRPFYRQTCRSWRGNL